MRKGFAKCHDYGLSLRRKQGYTEMARNGPVLMGALQDLKVAFYSELPT